MNEKEAVMTDALPGYADTIVIGAGTGGAACAGMLASHSGGSVPVLGARPDDGGAGRDHGPFPRGRGPGDMLAAKSIPLSPDGGLVWAPPQGLDLPRARIVG